MTSVVEGEVARFGGLAGAWWDRRGPMAPLHAMNPLRVGWVDARVRAAFGGPARLLDVGCGAGLASEALARLGHDVLGVDAGAEVIEAARVHAERLANVKLAYRVATAEALLAGGERFGAITALEVIEHVADQPAFVADLAGLLGSGGVLVLSTLNRTRRSYAVAKLGAEYVLRLLPVGTHDWKRFVTPVELGAMLRAAGLRVTNVAGMVFDPLLGRWRESRETGINYIMAARKD